MSNLEKKNKNKIHFCELVHSDRILKLFSWGVLDIQLLLSFDPEIKAIPKMNSTLPRDEMVTWLIVVGLIQLG